MKHGQRRLAVAVSLTAACIVMGGTAQAHEPPGSVPPELAALIARGESLLAVGDASSAATVFEQAAGMAHASRIELGLLRAQMQQGAYKPALAFAAHTAGVHDDDVAGRVFYAWLLDRGAQPQVAEQTLALAEATAPQDVQVRALRQLWTSGQGALPTSLRHGPAVLAPVARGVRPPVSAQVVSAGALWPDGRHAWVPADVVASTHPGATPHWWLRNGLGDTVDARIEAMDAPSGVAVLVTGTALPAGREGGRGLELAPRDPFAGSPAYAFDQPVDPTGASSWPVMRAGFVGMAGRLGVRLPGVGPRGGPVLDPQGRLLGLAWHGDGPASPDRLLPVSAWRDRLAPVGSAQASSGARPALDAESVYEQGLRQTLQVLRAD